MKFLFYTEKDDTFCKSLIELPLKDINNLEIAKHFCNDNIDCDFTKLPEIAYEVDGFITPNTYSYYISKEIQEKIKNHGIPKWMFCPKNIYTTKESITHWVNSILLNAKEFINESHKKIDKKSIFH